MDYLLLFRLSLSPEDHESFDIWGRKNKKLIAQSEGMSAAQLSILYTITCWQRDNMIEEIKKKTEELSEENEIKKFFMGQYKKNKQRKSDIGKFAADKRHGKPGGSRERREKILEIWATGKYSSRDICAEQEWGALGYGSLKAARNALTNAPEPSNRQRRKK